jgi:hypothetical protein
VSVVNFHCEIEPANLLQYHHWRGQGWYLAVKPEKKNLDGVWNTITVAMRTFSFVFQSDSDKQLAIVARNINFGTTMLHYKGK